MKIKEAENRKLQEIEQRYENNIKTMREEMNHQISQIMSMIQQNPMLARVKPEVLMDKPLKK